jgi:hypothetical protein
MGTIREKRDEGRGTRTSRCPPRSAGSEALGEAFLALVRRTGNAEAAARALGAGHAFHNRMRRDAGFRRRYREAAAAAGRPRPVKRARARWSPELGEKFLAILRETGNARQAALRLRAPNAFSKRMRVDPAFRRDCHAAAAEADARLRGAASPFPRPIEHKGKRLPTDAASLGGMLRPGRKRKPSQPEPVLRRNSKGRMQVTLTREGHWTSEIEADFLARLRATGNFDACARAVGFQPNSVHERERVWAAFARDCDRALEEASVRLTYRLAAHAHALMRKPGEAEAAGIEEAAVPFDPAMAMKILGHIEARKYGRSGRGRRKGPPERTFEQACESILAKIEAIERHEKMMKERKEAEDGDTA